MRRKPLPNALDIDLRGGLTERVTPHAGVALLVDCLRRAGVPAAADRYLPAKRSPKGLGQGQMTEAFVLLSALGGRDARSSRDGAECRATAGWQARRCHRGPWARCGRRRSQGVRRAERPQPLFRDSSIDGLTRRVIDAAVDRSGWDR